MEPTLTWLDLTGADREQMRRVLALFKEGTVDELGLGTIRDAFAGELFPGVTSLQTRLRYVLFIPWVYRQLEAKRTPSDRVAEVARRAEVALIHALAESDDEGDWGVIGIQARNDLQRLPSSVYWRCCIRWGVFTHDRVQSWYHTHFRRLSESARGKEQADVPGVVSHGQTNWHPQLPPRPDGFPQEVGFALTREEAEFIQGRIAECCAGTLLAKLAANPRGDWSESLWDEADAVGATGEVGETVKLARRFSRHVEGIPLLYNLMLAEKRRKLYGDDGEGDDSEDPHGSQGWAEGYAEEWGVWAQEEAQEEPFDGRDLWDWLARHGHRYLHAQRSFIDNWTARLAVLDLETAKDDSGLRNLIAYREHALKKGRSRLKNPKRLLHWRGRSGVGRMTFNWSRARQMLLDLHEGLV